jgi:hypothetical protein
MAYDGDILSIKVFTDCDKWASRAHAAVTQEVNDYLRNYPAELVQSIQAHETEFTDTGGDYPVQLTRYTVTVVLKS